MERARPLVGTPGTSAAPGLQAHAGGQGGNNRAKGARNAGCRGCAAPPPPYPYGGEFIAQFLFALRLCWFPMIIASVAFTYGPAGIQAANFLNLFGALDRLGGIFVLTVLREFAPLVCAIVM